MVPLQSQGNHVLKRGSVMKVWGLLPAVILSFCSIVSAGEITTFRFGVCLSTSGEFQAAGRKAVAGIKLRMDDFNSRSAETGLRLEMVYRDSESRLERALEILDELATEEKVSAVIGPLSTSLMLGMVDKAREHKMVLISPTVTSPKIGKNHDWAFRLLFDDEFQGVALARYIEKNREQARVGVIMNSRLPYAESVYRSFKKHLEENGGTVVAEERYAWVASEDDPFDFHPLLTRMAEANPDAVLLPVNSTEVAAIIRASLDTDLKTVFCGGDTWQHENILLSSGNNLENAFFVCGIDFESQSPEMRRFLYLFDHSNDPEAQPTSILGYDALGLLIAALEHGRDGESIRAALYSIRGLELASGTITIRPEKGSEKSAFINRIVKVDDKFASTIIDEIKPE